MKKYDFDQIIDRSGSNDIKHSVLQERWGRSDLLPLWVADMDFATPDFIASLAILLYLPTIGLPSSTGYNLTTTGTYNGNGCVLFRALLKASGLPLTSLLVPEIKSLFNRPYIIRFVLPLKPMAAKLSLIR